VWQSIVVDLSSSSKSLFPSIFILSIASHAAVQTTLKTGPTKNRYPHSQHKFWGTVGPMKGGFRICNVNFWGWSDGRSSEALSFSGARSGLPQLTFTVTSQSNCSQILWLHGHFNMAPKLIFIIYKALFLFKNPQL